MMQYFEWYLPENCKLWKQLSKNAAELNKNINLGSQINLIILQTAVGNKATLNLI